MKRLQLFLILTIAALFTPHNGPARAQQGAEKKWDVSQPFGPTTAIAFDTAEGTWMNLDVSPDGRTIVFDLLGDIYAMPIAGTGSGAATRLTSGLAFDMQPRFSPDGKRIAFTSDRDGLWNIWIDGPRRQQRRCSLEGEPLVREQPGVVGRRQLHLRAPPLREGAVARRRRDLDVPRERSEGLQVTEKNGWQKDAGEPAVSPDGRYLYYSKDVTPGQSFEYNKDPYGTIYAIVRRDLNDGRSARSRSVRADRSRPACHPTARRSRSCAACGWRPCSSCATSRPAPSGRCSSTARASDMQEAWAVHGVYPQYAWMPDGKALVDLGAGQHLARRRRERARHRDPIPRAASADHDQRAARFPHEVLARARPGHGMLRHVTHVAGRQARRVQRARPRSTSRTLPDGVPRIGVTCGAGLQSCELGRHRGVPLLLARRRIHRLHLLERRGRRPRAGRRRPGGDAA